MNNVLLSSSTLELNQVYFYRKKINEIYRGKMLFMLEKKVSRSMDRKAAIVFLASHLKSAAINCKEKKIKIYRFFSIISFLSVWNIFFLIMPTIFPKSQMGA